MSENTVININVSRENGSDSVALSAWILLNALLIQLKDAGAISSGLLVEIYEYAVSLAQQLSELPHTTESERDLLARCAEMLAHAGGLDRKSHSPDTPT